MPVCPCPFFLPPNSSQPLVTAIPLSSMRLMSSSATHGNQVVILDIAELFHSLKSSLDSPMTSQMTGFYSIYGQIKFHAAYAPHVLPLLGGFKLFPFLGCYEYNLLHQTWSCRCLSHRWILFPLDIYPQEQDC